MCFYTKREDCSSRLQAEITAKDTRDLCGGNCFIVSECSHKERSAAIDPSSSGAVSKMASAMALQYKLKVEEGQLQKVEFEILKCYRMAMTFGLGKVKGCDAVKLVVQELLEEPCTCAQRGGDAIQTLEYDYHPFHPLEAMEIHRGISRWNCMRSKITTASWDLPMHSPSFISSIACFGHRLTNELNIAVAPSEVGLQHSHWRISRCPQMVIANSHRWNDFTNNHL